MCCVIVVHSPPLYCVQEYKRQLVFPGHSPPRRKVHLPYVVPFAGMQGQKFHSAEKPLMDWNHRLADSTDSRIDEWRAQGHRAGPQNCRLRTDQWLRFVSCFSVQHVRINQTETTLICVGRLTKKATVISRNLFLFKLTAARRVTWSLCQELSKFRAQLKASFSPYKLWGSLQWIPLGVSRTSNRMFLSFGCR